MPIGKYPHNIGEKSSRWKGGKPHCLDCGVILISYVSKRCRKCNAKFYSGKRHPFYEKHHSDKTKEKIKQSKLKNPVHYWLGKKHAMTYKSKTCAMCKKEFSPKSGNTIYCLNCRKIKKKEWKRISKFGYRFNNRKLMEPQITTKPIILKRPLTRVIQTRESARKWRERHRQEHRNRNKEWRKNNKEMINFMNRRREHQIRGAKGYLTWNEWQEIKHKFNYTCPSCGKKEPEIKLTVDHIIPVSKGGTNNKENIQPLCISCNSKKWAHNILLSPLEVVT